MLSEKAIRDMILSLVNELDYDLAKTLDPKCAEDPDESRQTMLRLIAIVRKHLAKAGAK